MSLYSLRSMKKMPRLPIFSLAFFLSLLLLWKELRFKISWEPADLYTANDTYHTLQLQHINHHDAARPFAKHSEANEKYDFLTPPPIKILREQLSSLHFFCFPTVEERVRYYIGAWYKPVPSM